MFHFHRLIKQCSLLILLCLPAFYALGDEDLPEVEIIKTSDFSKLSQVANDQQKLIMLEVSATYCSFCRKLEEEIIKPMLRSGDYDDRVLIRKFEIDEHHDLKNFDGSVTNPGRLARQLNIKVTPTIIFLNSQNQEVSKRIVGVNSLDYFGGYVDDAIDHGLVAIR